MPLLVVVHCVYWALVLRWCLLFIHSAFATVSKRTLTTNRICDINVLLLHKDSSVLKPSPLACEVLQIFALGLCTRASPSLLQLSRLLLPLHESIN